MDTVHVRFLRYSAFYTPLLATIAGPYLAEEGLRATFDTAAPDRTVEDGLRSGTVQVGQSAPAVSFPAALRGEDTGLRHFACLNARDGFFLAARTPTPDFRFADLVGRTVLVDHFFQPMAMFRTALVEAGVDPAAVHMVDAGGPEAIEAAFRNGQGDFVHLQGPVPQQLAHEGLATVVASVGEAVGPVAFSSLYATPAWLATDQARAFMRAFRKARTFARLTPPEQVARVVGPLLPSIAAAPLVRAVERYQRMGTWLADETFTPALHARAVEVFLRVGYVDGSPPADLIYTAAPH